MTYADNCKDYYLPNNTVISASDYSQRMDKIIANANESALPTISTKG